MIEERKERAIRQEAGKGVTSEAKQLFVVGNITTEAHIRKEEVDEGSQKQKKRLTRQETRVESNAK